VIALDAGHDVMISRPRELAELLNRTASEARVMTA
jgi:hypothetical protein